MANQYTPEQRTEAVNAYLEHGATEASRITGIPKRTISRWATNTGATAGKDAQTQAARVALSESNELQRLRTQKRKLQEEVAGLVGALSETDRLHTDTEARRAARALLPKKPSRVYVIADTDMRFVKIGVAKNVDQRLAAIQSCCPLKLTVVAVVPGGYRVERWLHGRLSPYRVHGEWFEISGEVAAFVDDPELWMEGYGTLF